MSEASKTDRKPARAAELDSPVVILGLIRDGRAEPATFSSQGRA